MRGRFEATVTARLYPAQTVRALRREIVRQLHRSRSDVVAASETLESFRITVGDFPLEDSSRTLREVGIAKDGPTVFVSRPREVRLGVNERSEEDPEEELGAGAEWNRLGGEITVGQHASDHRRIEHER